jgi:hypothetical protein
MTHAQTLLRPLLAALALAALWGAPARAQTGNFTDPSFPLPGGAFGGSYLGPGIRTENEMFRFVGERVQFRNSRIACAVRGAAQAYADSTAPLARSAGQALVDRLAGLRGAPDPGAVEAVAAALRAGASPESELGQAAREVAEAFAGLFRGRGSCVRDVEAYGEAPDWERAIRAFREFVERAPDTVFAPPSDELLELHAALSSVVYAALREARR